MAKASAIDFPDSPSLGEIYTYGTAQYVYTSDGWILGTLVSDTWVVTNAIYDYAVTAIKLAADSVTTVKVVDLNITTAKIAELAVTAAKLAADSVTTAKILDANVTTAKINDLAVTNAKVATGISMTKLTSDVSNQLPTGLWAGTFNISGVGTGQGVNLGANGRVDSQAPGGTMAFRSLDINGLVTGTWSSAGALSLVSGAFSAGVTVGTTLGVTGVATFTAVPVCGTNPTTDSGLVRKAFLEDRTRIGSVVLGFWNGTTLVLNPSTTFSTSGSGGSRELRMAAAGTWEVTCIGPVTNTYHAACTASAGPVIGSTNSCAISAVRIS